ncbi:MAG: tripartite tricarboxylate transporter substrate binding protein [Burkholderiales bacterium]|nr:tripartite tricarboxylate transporter substrate binding protein [Burkholderiales bacterium]
MMRRRAGLALALCVAALAAVPAHGQDKTIRLQVPFATGGGTDILARILAPRLAERLGQPVIVENRAGAAGAIGARYTAQAAPDGQTLMIGSISEIGINPSVTQKLGYDVWRDFVAVAPLASTPMILVAHPSVPAATPREVIALAGARPGQLNYGSAGAGSGAHMGAELFRYVTRVDITHVPYKGTGAAVADLAGGQVQLVFTTVPSVIGLVKGGRLKPIAVATTQRVPTLPEVPTFAESGVPEYLMDYWYGLFAPAATPREIQTRLQAALRDVMRLPDVASSLDKAGLIPTPGTPEEFTAFVRKDMERWAAVVKAAGIKVD